MISHSYYHWREYVEITSFHALWGMPGSLSEQLHRAKQHGYEGIEAPMPSQEQHNEFITLMDELQLAYIPQIFTSNNHEESFQEQVERAKQFSPVLINSHSGKDYMSEDEQNRFLNMPCA